MADLSSAQIARINEKFMRVERSSTLHNSAPPNKPPPPSTPNRGDGNGSDMEARIAKLEATMEHVRNELAKLSTVPADLATLKERTSHLPTKADMKDEIKGSIDRAATRIQRNFAIVGIIVSIVVAVINYGPRFI